MKKEYITPKVKAVALRSPNMMTSGSYTMRSFTQGEDTTIGDTDEEY